MQLRRRTVARRIASRPRPAAMLGCVNAGREQPPATISQHGDVQAGEVGMADASLAVVPRCLVVRCARPAVEEGHPRTAGRGLSPSTKLADRYPITAEA
jgi:hypothetical protein